VLLTRQAVCALAAGPGSVGEASMRLDRDGQVEEGMWSGCRLGTLGSQTPRRYCGAHVTLTWLCVPKLQSVGLVCPFLRWQRRGPIPSSAASGKIGDA
jgi:hypothetical protein